jgi:hypothetical protein
MMDDIKLYRADISEDDSDDLEVNFISLVNSPAIETNFLAFKAVEKNPGGKMRFSIEDEEERIVTGLAMIADLPIYRNDSERGEYYVYFDAQAIKKIALRFFRKGYTNNVNIEHKSDKIAKGVYFFESLLIDRDKGKNPPPAFEDVPNGSWLVSAKVDNEDVWKQVKEGTFKGFSVEGFFNLDRIQLSKQDEEFDPEFIQALKDVLKEFQL